MKINTLEFENVKRIKAVKMEPAKDGLTIIGGKNGQGKTSVLDAIAWALGGERYRPSDAQRDGSVIPPVLKVTLDNGIIVERSGKNSSLKVIDPQGNKGGQTLLDAFISQFALDLPRFMNSTSKEKANTLLKIIGVGEKLFELETKETTIYNQRHAIGQIAEQKKAFAKEMPKYPDVPEVPIEASELILQQQEILARNGENQRKRENAAMFKDSLVLINERIQAATDTLNKLLAERTQIEKGIEIAEKTIETLVDESTAELEASIRNIETINTKVRANLDREKAEEDAKTYSNQYDELTSELENVRKAKSDLLNSADLPLPGLSVKDGELTYNGFKWDNMSASEQLKVSVAIVRKLNPECQFVLIDKLEQMDVDTLNNFGEWLEKEGLQAIATRVSSGDECAVIIEDGYAVSNTPAPKTWKEGEF